MPMEMERVMVPCRRVHRGTLIMNTAIRPSENRANGTYAGTKNVTDKIAYCSVSSPQFNRYSFASDKRLEEVAIQQSVEIRSDRKKEKYFDRESIDAFADTMNGSPAIDPLSNVKMHVPDAASLYEQYNAYQ